MQMSALSDYLEYQLLNHILRGNEQDTSFSQPAAVYVALFLGDPGESGDFTNEVPSAGTGYARQQVTFDSPIDDGEGGKKVVNNIEVSFQASGSDWGVVTHFAICDSSLHRGGNVLFKGSLSRSRDVADGDIVKFVVGSLVVKLR